MNQIQKNPTLFQIKSEDNLDYSEMYRTQETIQLNKRLRKTRNILLICAAAVVLGATIFLLMPGAIFTTKDTLVYVGFAAIIFLLSALSNKQPYYSLLAALVICMGLWGMEVIFNDTESLLILFVSELLAILSNTPLPSSPMILAAIFSEI